MNNNPVKSIKKSQKESLYLKEIGQLFLEVTIEQPDFRNIFINKVVLSDDGGICFVYFYSLLGKAEFERVFDQLKLYKPSMRKALASRIAGRYTPNIVFKYDDQLKKQLDIEELIERVKNNDLHDAD